MKFNFKKKYGQNFLQDASVIDKIVSSFEATEDDLIIEIGPGAGALTKKMVKKNTHFLAYEIDVELRNQLTSLESEKVHFIFDDFMKRDIKEDIKDINYHNLYIVGNLPYYITTPIITKIIEADLNPSKMVFMVQKEVASRFSAKPSTRDYGSITVFLNYYFDVNVLFTVNRNKFYPVPNVDSAVISFMAKKERLAVDFSKFNRMIKDSFTFKRKNLRNNLKSYDLNKIATTLDSFDKSLDNRAEDLSYVEFVELVNSYYSE